MRIETIGNATLYLGDCIEVMAGLPDASVDMILCDLPYGTTACKWDTVIPFEPLWAQYKRVIKRNGAIVLTASQPFTTALISSNMAMFRYEWIWVKNVASGFANAKRQPMKSHESALVFYQEQPAYNRQPTKSKITDRAHGGRNTRGPSLKDGVYGGLRGLGASYLVGIDVCPRTVIEFDVTPRAKGTVHPTQKPVALMEYLIRTYTHDGETVLDNCAGSFTTGVACLNTGRRFIGIERDDGYFRIGSDRMAKRQVELDTKIGA